jgi:hypothetical protein
VDRGERSMSSLERCSSRRTRLCIKPRVESAGFEQATRPRLLLSTAARRLLATGILTMRELE